MKHELDKATGPMIKETENVKVRVLSEIHSPKIKKKSAWRYSIVPIVIFILLFSGVLFALQVQQKQSAASIKHQQSNLVINQPTLNPRYFEVLVYQMQYFNNQFWTEEQAKMNMFDTYLSDVAMVAYAKKQGIKVNDKEIKTKAKEMQKQFLKDLSSNKEVTLQYSNLFNALHMTQQDYFKNVLLFNAELTLIEDGLLEKLHIQRSSEEYTDFNAIAGQYYKNIAMGEINNFKNHFNITDSKKSNELSPLKEPIDLSFDYKKSKSLELGVNEAGKLEFVDPYAANEFMMNKFMDLMVDINYKSEVTLPFSPLTYSDYKIIIEYYAKTDNKYKKQAQQFLDMLKIYERSYEKDYDLIK